MHGLLKQDDYKFGTGLDGNDLSQAALTISPDRWSPALTSPAKEWPRPRVEQ